MSTMMREGRAALASGVNNARIVAGAFWLVGVATTYVFISNLAPGWGWAWAAALIVQWFLTALEGPVWARQPDALSVTALGMDVAINAGGLYVVMLNLDQTPTWRAFAGGLGLSGGDMSNWAALAASCIVGLVLAAAPEALWRRGS